MNKKEGEITNAKTGSVIMVYFLPCQSIMWGALYLIIGNSIYDSMPDLYINMRQISSIFWGTISLICGCFALYAQVYNHVNTKRVCSALHAWLLLFVAWEMRSSILACCWFVLLGGFELMRFLELIKQRTEV